MLLTVLLCALLGCVVGFLAGLLGIGGGLLIVPFLSLILLEFNLVDTSQVMVVSIATSLASIIFTSTSSALAHHKNKNVPWEITPWVMVGVSFGALSSGFFASLLPLKVLKVVFIVSVTFIAARMIFSRDDIKSSEKVSPSGPFLTGITSLMGALSAMIGIGGGALIVPLLSHFSIDMKKAIGCASVCGIVIAFFGSLGYVLSGFNTHSIQEGFFGHIYLPALLGIVSTSSFFAPIGAKATHTLPVKTIKKVFAGLLVVIAVSMLFR